MRANWSPALEDWLRRPDIKARLIAESCVTAKESDGTPHADIRQRKDQWDDASGGYAGFDLQNDGGVVLSSTNITVLDEAAQDGFFRSTDRRHQRVDLQVVSITRSGTTATVTVESLNALTPTSVLIAGATPTDYNGTKAVTVTGATTFTFAVGGAVATPATGVLTCKVLTATFTTNGGIFRCARVDLDGTPDPDTILREVRAYLTPDAGGLGASDVRWWECHVLQASLAPFSPLHTLELIPLGDPVRMLAPASAGTVTFDFSPMQLKPKKFHGTGEANHLLIVMYALNATGGLAHNCGWGRNTGAANVTTSGNILRGVELVESGAPERWIETDLTMTPYVRVRFGSYASATLTFGAGVFLDLGGTPTGTVEFVGQGEVPPGTSITYEVSDDAGSNWYAFVDGDTAQGLGILVQQTYWVRATLDPGAGGSTPILRQLGAREVTLLSFDNLCTITGDQGAIDPLTLKGKIGQITIKAIRDGEADYMDAISDLLSGNYLGDIEWRVWCGWVDDRTGTPAQITQRKADAAAHRLPDGTPWMLIDTYVIDDYAVIGGSVELTCISPLSLLKAVLPIFDQGTSTRTAVTYPSGTVPDATIRAVSDDLMDTYLELPARYSGPRVPDETTRVSKTIEDSEAKAELDALAFLAGGGYISSQSRLIYRDMFGPKASVARIPWQELTWGPVSPGFRNRLPEYFVPYDWDYVGGSFRYETQGYHADALARLGRARIDPPTVLDDLTAQWIRSVGVTSITRSGSTATVTTDNDHDLSDGELVTILGALQDEYNVDSPPPGVVVTGATTFTYTVSGTPASPATGTITCAILPHRIANRTTRYLGPGLMLLPVTLKYPHPELEVGDMISVETDRFVARDPTQDNRPLRGRIWVKAVVQSINDLWGMSMTLWVRSYADIASTQAGGTRPVRTIRCKAHSSGDVAHVAAAVVKFDTEDYDDGDMHDNVTDSDRFYAPIDGRYNVVFYVHYTSSGFFSSTATFAIKWNGAVHGVQATQSIYTGGGGEQDFQLHTVIDMARGDWVGLEITSVGGFTVTIKGGSWGTVSLVGAGSPPISIRRPNGPVILG